MSRLLYILRPNTAKRKGMSYLAMGSLKGKKAAVIGLAVIAAGCGFMEFRRSKIDDPVSVPAMVRPVRTERLVLWKASFKGIYQGTVQASQKVELSFRVSGPLVEFSVKKGQKVQKGQVLGKIDPRDFKNTLDSAESQLKQLEAKLQEMRSGARAEDLAQAQAAVASAEAQEAEAQANYKRFKALKDQGAVSEVQYEQYKTAYGVAQSSLRSARENLKKAKAGARKEEIAQQEAAIQSQRALVQSALSALSDTELKAPFDGIAADTYADNHQFVQAKQPVLSLQDLSVIEMVVNVPDSDIINLKESLLGLLKMKAAFDGLPGRTFQVKLKEFATQADPKTQTYPVTLYMAYPKDATVLPGMAVSLEVEGTFGKDEGEYPFTVDPDGVFSDEMGQSSVWLYDQGVVKKTPVEVGPYKGGMMTISGDLKAGDLIVTAGVHFLKEGQAVRLMEGN